jgi:hypothetical protein
MKEDKMRIRCVLPIASLLAGTAGAAAIAQTPPIPTATYDPQQLPAIQGKVAQFSLTPRGDVDGLILEDGTQVHLPPHLGTQLVYAVKPGDAITVRGLKARAIPMIEAMSVTNDATKSVVTDTGPGGPKGPRALEQPLSAEGRIKVQLHGPQGELNGVMLENGTIVRLPPPEAERLAAQLSPGQPLYVQGNGVTGPLGTVIAAQAAGPSQAQLVQLQAPRPDGPRRGKRKPPPPAGPDTAPL